MRRFPGGTLWAHLSPVDTLIEMKLRRRLGEGVPLTIGLSARFHHGITPAHGKGQRPGAILVRQSRRRMTTMEEALHRPQLDALGPIVDGPSSTLS